AARTFNAGFNTVEFTSSALVDMAFHTRTAVDDPMAVQAEVLAEIGMPKSIVMRHATSADEVNSTVLKPALKVRAASTLS
ncbi:hypothetical protein ACC676_39560, partial [Rhizobium ruizarguesonis]